MLSYLEAEHLDANTSLVKTLKNGRRVVYRRDIKSIFHCTKENLFQFSEIIPTFYQVIRSKLIEIESKRMASEVEEGDERVIAQALSLALQSIQPGDTQATEYHRLMIGIVEFLFFPNLIYPKKEREIHQGRKRIDIVMENGARSGIFQRLHQIRHLPCAFVAFECKNYFHRAL